jgi:quinolinate synthase
LEEAMDSVSMINEISRMKKEKNAVIVAHYYQADEVQEIADITGDSFALSRYCADSVFDIIVFCGVRFMAESAYILSPEKKVLLPVLSAGCPMADMIDADELRREKAKYDDLTVVCYVNSTAEVKAESDICCTSSNAVKVVRSAKTKNVLFVPDRNLGSYVKDQVKEKNVILWNGYCITHERADEDTIIEAKAKYPAAIALLHPECNPGLLGHADFIGSTKQIIDYARNSDNKEFIIGTEQGILYQLKKDSPDKKFYLLSQDFICFNMKKTRLADVYGSLKYERYVIKVDEDIRRKAEKSLQRMLEIV